ncbi:hypothetical protein [Clostridium thailandense]|uniref:hypothetical protein n=1 Tax=Clostridium thailandense TaxID=2794346 RepID=UPI003989DABF
MNKLKKLATIAASVAMATSLFTGCSYDATSLANAFSKTQKATSSESKTEINLKFSAENLSAEEQNSVNKVIPMINNASIVMNSKMNQNESATAAKAQIDMSAKFGDMPLDLGVWVDSSSENDKLSFKEIIKLPAIAQSEMNGKQYVVLDSSKMNGASGMDFSKLTQTSEDMQKKLSELIAKSMVSFDPNFTFITNKGSQYMNLPDGNKPVHLYQVTLNDKNFKSLVKYTSNNLVNNADARDFLKDYMIAMTKVSNLKEEDSAAAEAEINKSFSDFEKGLPEFTKQMNKVLDSFDKVTIIGDRGIVINYAVDENGYVVSENGYMDLVFDAPNFISTVQSLSGSKGASAANTLTGVYKLGIDFNSTIYNINKDVEIKFPEITDENSIQYEDLFKQGTKSTQAKIIKNELAKVK